MAVFATMLTQVNWEMFTVWSIPGESVLFLLLALIVSAAGFYRIVYFVSLGYAFSIATMAVTSMILFWQTIHWVLLLQCSALAAYGLRLGGYLTQREFQPSFRKELTEIHERTKGMAWSRKFGIWIGVSVLYVLMFSPCLFMLGSQRAGMLSFSLTLPLVGIAVMVLGLLLETLADQQKSKFKQSQPKRFCDVGLYRWIRCPNYLGEILFWVGNWITGIVSYDHGLRWTFATVGLLCIVLIMMGSTKRLEHKQGERYGHLPEYQAYIKTVPVLFPFVPLYSLKKVRVYLE